MTGDRPANSASAAAKRPVDAAAPVDAIAAHAYRLEQARKLLDDVAASLPEGDSLRRAIERGREAEGLPPLPASSP